MKEMLIGNISFANSTTRNDKESCREENEMHEDDGEHFGMGFEFPAQAVLAKPKMDCSLQLK